MSKYLLAIPIILAPYSILFGLYCIFTGFLIESVFRNNGLLVLLAVVIFFAVAVLFTVILCIVLFVTNNSAVSLARLNMIIKLCHVPAYCIIFLLGALFFLTIFTYAFTIVFFLLDCVTIGMSGAIGAIATLRAHRQKALPVKKTLRYGILQFIFCADVVTCVSLFITAIKAQKAKSAAKATNAQV